MKYTLTFLLFWGLHALSAQNADSLLSAVYFHNNLGLLENNGFSFNQNYTVSPSYWALTFPENKVFQAELNYTHAQDATQSFKVRIGKGGQLYSFRSTFGEMVAPQWRNPNTIPSTYGGGSSFAPWMDEVWQMVAVDYTKNHAPDSLYMIHQAGVYLKIPSLTQPFYSPTVAEYFNPTENSYSVVNWGQQAHTDQITGYTATTLFYTKYSVLGKGILQVDNMVYNFGNDTIGHLNVPFGGVRRSSLDYLFVSTPTNGYQQKTGQFGTAPIIPVSNTAAWVAWANDSLAHTATLGLATSQRTNTLNSYYRYGDTGNPTPNNVRNLQVFTNVRQPNNLSFGKAMSFRYFYVLGANIDSVRNKILQYNLTNAALDTLYIRPKTATTPLNYRFFRNGTKITPVLDNTGSGLSLRSSPYQNSYPLFLLTASDSSQKVSSNPYQLSPIPYNGITAKVKLLGFLDKKSVLTVVNDTIFTGSNYTFPDGTSIQNVQNNLFQVSKMSAAKADWDSLVVSNVVIQNPLPLTFLHFSASSIKDAVYLEWETENFTSSYRSFEVERANHDTTFVSIAKISEVENQTKYTYWDKNMTQTELDYRLKISDINGGIAYSPTISVQLSFQEKELFFPNPTHHFLFSEKTVEKVTIYSMEGALMESYADVIFMDISHLAEGIYVIKALNEGKSYVQKLVKR